ncbi:GNAT family N-acetyltransferase [Candidatus Woesearchaeota archaeon]|nr:GNAT family N-acetyltransferase [Candidatus Woesearchaeota archaeon]
MQVRKAAEKDSEGIANVLVSSYNIADLEEARQVFLDETKKYHHYIVAEEDDRIIGVVTWAMHGLPKHMLCELDRIAVLPEFRGKGISVLLFNFMKEDADNEYKRHGFRLRKLYLLTHDDNERAHAFYHKMGFEHETTLKQHYYKDKDEYVFSMFFE